MIRLSRGAPGLRAGAALFAILCLGWPTTVAAIATRPSTVLASAAIAGRSASDLVRRLLGGPLDLASVAIAGGGGRRDQELA